MGGLKSVAVEVTAVTPVYFTPRSHPWLCPGFHPRRRGWNVTKLNCSQPPFAASVRHCPGLLSSFQSLLPFSSQAVLSNSPFGCAKVCVLIYCPFHRVFWCPLAESFPDSGSVGLFDSCNLSRPKAFRSSSRTAEVNFLTRQSVVTTANSRLYERTM